MSYHDHFPGSTLDARWTAVTAGAGTVTVTDSYAKLVTGATADAAFIHSTAKIDLTKWQTITVCINPRVTGAAVNWLYLVNRALAPVATTQTTFELDARIRLSFATVSSVLGMQFSYYNASHVRQVWNGATNVWQGTNVHAYSIVEADDYYEVTLEIDGPGSRIRVLGRHKAVSGTAYSFDQGYRYFAISNWVAFSGMETMSDPWLVVGDVYTDQTATGEARVEYVRLADGTRDHLWTNGKDATTGVFYSIKHWHTFDGEFAVPEDRTTQALVAGTTGAWDDEGVQARTVVQDGATLYMIYAGNDGSGYQLGLATATSPDGPWTKFAGNPIVARGTGDESSAYAPYLNLDNELDPNKRAKLIYSSVSTIDNKYRLYYRTAPDPDGPWSASTLIMDAGGAGTYDVFGWNNPVFKWLDGQWELWGSSKSGTGLSHEHDVSRAYGASLTTLTKDPLNPIIVGRVDAKQDLSADLNGRIASMASTAGFQADGVVILDKDATGNNYSVSRIRKINTDVSLELYHSLKGFELANAAHVRQLDAGAITVHEIRQVGSEWWVYATLFSTYGTHATLNAAHETTAIYVATARAGPYTCRWRSSPVTGTTQWGSKRSSENIAFLRTPIASAPASGGTQPRRLRMYEGY